MIAVMLHRHLLRLAVASTLFSLAAGCGDDAGETSSGSGGNGGESPSTSSGTTSTTGSTSSTSSGVTGEPAELAGITEAHNVARANVVPAAATPLPPLTWDDTLAGVAQAYAEKCIWAHSTDNDYGENLYANTGSGTTPQDVVEGWVSEDEFYDYESNSCVPGEMCGHYTQVVWADTLRVGCGVANCTTGSPFDGSPEWRNWVCNYDPPGNWVGEKPY
jgi:pathogenesis-related protein 1